jgi:hypothetical protein
LQDNDYNSTATNMSDFKAILEELLITEQRLGTLCDSSAAIYGGVNSLLTESLGDGPAHCDLKILR